MEAAFQNGINVPKNLGFAAIVTEDGKVATVIFDNLMVSLDPVGKGLQLPDGAPVPASNRTAIATKTATVNIPIVTNQRSVSITLDVRGFATVDPGANARLVIFAGDQTRVVKLSRKKVEMKGKLMKELKDQGRKIDGDFHERFGFKVQRHAAKPDSKTVCQLTTVLVVEHDTDVAGQGGALLAVDSFDLSFEGGTVGKK